MATKSSRLAIILGLNDRGFNAGLTRAAARFKKFGGQMQAAGRGLTTGVTGPLTLLTGVAGKAAVDFEFAMAKVGAVAQGVSEQGMAKLEKSAKDLGASTAFSASEVAGLQLELAKLGFAQNVDDILQMEEGILSVAQAFDNDLGETAEVVGNTLRQFGLDASQAGKVTDIMAVAFGNSALDLERFGSAMGNVAPIARDAGLNLEETTTLLGILANNGINGADAGTKLKIALTNIRAAGLDVGDTLKQITSGSFDFESSLSLLGKRAQIVAPILGANAEATAAFNEQLNNADGAANDARAILENTTQGALAKMRSALEALAISFGEVLLPRITAFADRVGALASRFAALDGPTKETVLNIVAMASALGPALIVMGKLTSLAGTLIKVLGVLTGPWGLVAAAVVGAVVLIIQNWETLVAFFTQGEGTGFLNTVLDAFNQFATFLGNIINLLVTGALLFWETFGEGLVDIASTQLENLGSLFSFIFEGITRLFGAFNKLFQGDWEGFFIQIADFALTVLQILLQGFITIFETIGGVIDTIAGALGFEDVDVSGFIGDLGDTLLGGLEGMKRTSEEQAAETAEDYFGSFAGTLQGLFNGASFSLPTVSTGGGGGGTVTTGGGGGTGTTGEGVGLTGETQETINQMTLLEETMQSVGQVGRQAIDSIGQGLVDVINGTKTFGEVLKEIGLGLIKNLVSIAIGYAITSALSPFDPANLATGGTAGAAKAAAAPALVTALFGGLAAFAEGGAVLGPTLALIGENPASRGEFVVPFERVGQFVNQFQNDSAPTIVNGRIVGDDIHLSNRESDRVLSRRRII